MQNKFLLQTKNGKIEDVEILNLKNILNSSIVNLEYCLADYSELLKSENNSNNYIPNFENYIPVGSLEFVNTWLKIYYWDSSDLIKKITSNSIKDVTLMRPIEVPKVLRNFEFLGRDYTFTTKNNLPKTGYYFIKNVDKLKQFTYLGNLDYLFSNQEKFKDFIDGNYLYSSYLNFLSEYRIFVYDSKIKAIQYYDGDCTIFPNIDKIIKMVQIYSATLDRPKSYCMDVGNVMVGNIIDTFIIEVHPITSIGTYGYSGDDLPYMYKDGISWYIHKIRDYKSELIKNKANEIKFKQLEN